MVKGRKYTGILFREGFGIDATIGQALGIEVHEMGIEMYEVNWHRKNDTFSHCSVSRIIVIREGVLPGCTDVSITAVAEDGSKFQGSPGDYYETRELAWLAVKNDLKESIDAAEIQREKITIEIEHMRAFLKTI